MSTDETITEKIPAVRDGHTGELAIIPPEADDAWLASLRDDGQPLTDLALTSYPDQVVAALHGDPRVFDLAPLNQACIASASRAFGLFARAILTDQDPKVVTRRAAVVLMAGAEEMGTPMRCPCTGCTRETTITDSEPPGWKLSRAHTGLCGQIHQPLAIGGPIQWDVAGREDIMCPPCWQAQPKHAAAKATPVKAAAKTRRPRRRTPEERGVPVPITDLPPSRGSQARKAVNGTPPDAAA
jgi:hypothetical protein